MNGNSLVFGKKGLVTGIAEVPLVEEPLWLQAARLYIGLREIPGIQHDSTILGWLELLKSKIRDDETPWCATYVGGIFESIGIKSTKSLAARSYLDWGVKIDEPVVGCVVVFWRGSPKGWSGHVGFVVGRDAENRLLVLGGNQNDQVSIEPFDESRVLGYRMPKDEPYASNPLPLYASTGMPTSRNEA